jgi:hypothetical protein
MVNITKQNIGNGYFKLFLSGDKGEIETTLTRWFNCGLIQPDIMARMDEELEANDPEIFLCVDKENFIDKMAAWYIASMDDATHARLRLERRKTGNPTFERWSQAQAIRCWRKIRQMAREVEKRVQRGMDYFSNPTFSQGATE